jgi:hypothetical protein
VEDEHPAGRVGDAINVSPREGSIRVADPHKLSPSGTARLDGHALPVERHLAETQIHRHASPQGGPIGNWDEPLDSVMLGEEDDRQRLDHPQLAGRG